jgi:hypothetical protein
MALLPIKLRARDKGGAVTEVLCDTVKDAQRNAAELSQRGFTVTAEDNSGREIDVKRLAA